MHCLEEGEWTDDDVCPPCKAKGHVSPWRVSQCPVCNQEFFDAINSIKAKIEARKKVALDIVAGCLANPEEWLLAPNSLFGGRRPSDLVGTHDEKLLLDWAAQVKLGLFS